MLRAQQHWQEGMQHRCFIQHCVKCIDVANWVQETFRSFLPAARTSSTVLEVEFHPDMSPRPGPLEQGAIDSPQKLEELDKQEEVQMS